MRYLPIVVLLLLSSFASMAQVKLTSVALRVNMGVGISNKPNVLFGAPFILSSELSTTFNERWRVAAEYGTLAFRDAKYPYEKIGLLWSTYPKYSHQYVGLLVGHTLLRTDRPQKLFLSSGADYLLIEVPKVENSSGFGGFFNGKSISYSYERYLNIPIQLDYSIQPFGGYPVGIVFVGRWNANAYHSYPTVSLGINIPIYPLWFTR